MTKQREITYAVMGLGYVGLGLACALSVKHKVIGFDINAERVAALTSQRDSNGLLDEAQLLQSKVHYTATLLDIKPANFYIIAVSTPAYFYEAPNLKPLIHAVKQLGPMLKRDDIVVLESTVYPGTTEGLCVPILERLSGLTCGVDFHVGYSPERINPGDHQHGLQNTTKVIAAQNAKTLKIIQQTYLSICDTVHPVSSIEAAEAVKLLENTQRDVNIALMNEFAKITHALNLNTHEIIAAAKTKWSFLPFKPGFVGGHCISIDSHYLAFKAKRFAVQPDLILTARKVNDGMTQFIIQAMLKLLIKHGVDTRDMSIGILGVSYKENIPDLRNSLALKLLKELRECGLHYRVHDPLDYAAHRHELSTLNLEPFESLANLSVIILVVGHDYYRDLGLKNILKACKKPPILIDIAHLFVHEHQAFDDLIYWSL